MTPVVLRPGSVEEVAAIVKLANETTTAIVPQGGNTGLVGGQVPHNGEVVLSLNRLDKIREVDPVSNTMTVEAGVTLQRARQAAARPTGSIHNCCRRKAPAPSAAISRPTPAAPRRSRTASRRSHALGLEVVLADGRMLRNLNKLKKDNTGYDLKNLFIGAEGTLGIITAAVLQAGAEAALGGDRLCRRGLAAGGGRPAQSGDRASAGGVTTFELMTRDGVDAVFEHDPDSRNPLQQSYPWTVLIELSSQAESGLRETMEQILSDGMERELVLDATIADSLEQGKAFWRIREMIGEVQRHLGGSIRHDVSVPIAAVPAFIEEANAAVIKAVPGARPMPFGHVGDGNIHYNVIAPRGRGPPGVPGALGRGQRHRVRGREEIRRLDLGRARRRHDEARRAARLQGPGGARLHARHQEAARPERNLEPGEGAVAFVRRR